MTQTNVVNFRPVQPTSAMQQRADYHRAEEAKCLQSIANANRSHSKALKLVEQQFNDEKQRHAEEMGRIAQKGKEADEIIADHLKRTEAELAYHRGALAHLPRD